MSKFKRKIFVCVSVVCLMLLASTLITNFLVAVSVPIHWVGSCLKLYISENNGNWPPSEDDLISQGYLEISFDNRNNLKRYEVKTIRGYMHIWK